MPIADDAAMVTAGQGHALTPWQSLAGLLAQALFPAPLPRDSEARAAQGGPGEPHEGEPDPDEALLLALTSLPIY